MTSRRGFTISVRTHLPKHKHDKRIMELARELRALINDRRSDQVSDRMKGKPRSEETRAKNAAAQRGKKQSPETIARRVASRIGKKATNEHRLNMRAGQLARNQRLNPAVDPLTTAIFGGPR